MVQTLTDTPEGNGNMMDNTTIIFMNDNGEKHHSSKRRWPVIVIGNAGGNLRSDGRFVRFAKGTPLADFFVTLGDAAGVPLPGFGAADGKPAGRVLGLLRA